MHHPDRRLALRVAFVETPDDLHLGDAVTAIEAILVGQALDEESHGGRGPRVQHDVTLRIGRNPVVAAIARLFLKRFLGRHG